MLGGTLRIAIYVGAVSLAALTVLVGARHALDSSVVRDVVENTDLLIIHDTAPIEITVKKVAPDELLRMFAVAEMMRNHHRLEFIETFFFVQESAHLKARVLFIKELLEKGEKEVTPRQAEGRIAKIHGCRAADAMETASFLATRFGWPEDFKTATRYRVVTLRSPVRWAGDSQSGREFWLSVSQFPDRETWQGGIVSRKSVLNGSDAIIIILNSGRQTAAQN